jgi:hypothetical protein
MIPLYPPWGVLYVDDSTIVLQYRKNMDYKTFLIQWNKIKTETKSDCPRYVNDFMTSMNIDSKRGKIKVLDSIFVSELNMALKDSIIDFLGLS